MRNHDIPVADAKSEFMKQDWAASKLTAIKPLSCCRNTEFQIQFISTAPLTAKATMALLFSSRSKSQCYNDRFIKVLHLAVYNAF